MSARVQAELVQMSMGRQTCDVLSATWRACLQGRTPVMSYYPQYKASEISMAKKIKNLCSSDQLWL